MPASEFELIEKYFTASRQGAGVYLGVGDDCAVLDVPPGLSLAVTTDTLVDGVHFPVATSPADVACKSIAVNLSDLAAMGAEPRWITLSLTLPEVDENWVGPFAAELHAVLDRYRCTLVGGDITRGPLSITVQAMGLVERERCMRRDAARPGDRIYVTGTLGDAAIALQNLERETESRDWFLQRLNRPTPRVRFGREAAKLCSCCIDISDGLLADLGHILESSHVGARVRVHDVPISRQARLYFASCGGIDWPLIVTGGDDYELCLAVRPGNEQALQRLSASLDIPVTCIGAITQDEGLQLLDENGSEIAMNGTGYLHFQGS